MVMSGVVHAVAGQKIQHATAVFSEKLATKATVVLDIHAEQAEQCDPLRVDVLVVIRGRRRHLGRENRVGCGCHWLLMRCILGSCEMPPEAPTVLPALLRIPV